MPGKIINDVRVCGEENLLLGTVCIIDNAHLGRPHFGPDGNGKYHQWGQAGKESPIVSLPWKRRVRVQTVRR